MSAPLLGSVVLSDASLVKTQAKMSEAASKLSFSWVSPEMMFHVSASTAAGAFVYVSHASFGIPVGYNGAFLGAHTLLGMVLGTLLGARIVIGLYRVWEASKLVQDFNKVCRTMAVMTTFVGETLTVSAGAEIEKTAVAHFRFELVRLLNLAFYCYQLMLSGMKMSTPPSSLAPSGGSSEMAILSTVENPTVMVCKMIASAVEQQRAAKRISNEQTAVLMQKISELIETYHASLGLLLAPVDASFSSLTFFFTIIFSYTLGPIIAVNELGPELTYGHLGLTFTIFYSFMLSLFYFALYEAGKALEAPLKTAIAMVAIDDMGYTLSDDLSSLVDDDSVPVFLPRS